MQRNRADYDAGTESDDKWGLHQSTDDEVAPEIARLIDLSEYFTLSAPQEEIDDREFLEIVGTDPDEILSLSAVKNILSSLKSHEVRKFQELRQVVQVLEIYPTGETGYKTAMSLSRLAQWIHELVVNTVPVPVLTPTSTSTPTPAPAHQEEKLNTDARGSTFIPLSPPVISTTDDIMTVDKVNEQEGSGIDQAVEEEVVLVLDESVLAHENINPVRELQPHDLRYMTNQLHSKEDPVILVRKHAVLISLSPLRAIVTADRIVLSVPDGADSLLYILHDYLNESSTQGRGQGQGYGSNEFDFTTLSCEGRAYKALFATAIAIHRKEYDTISKQVKDTLDRIKKVKRITPALREEIRVLKISVDAQIISVAAYRRLFQDLLNDGDELALMNLSLLKQKPNLCIKPCAPEILSCCGDIKCLMESQLNDYEGTGIRLEFLNRQLQNTNKLVSIRLNTFQNDLIIVQVMLDCFMVSLGSGGLIAGMFCTNLYHGSDTATGINFWITAVFLTVFITVVFVFLESRLRTTLGISILETFQNTGPMKQLH